MSLDVRLEGELAEWVERRARESGITPDEFVSSTIQKALDCDQEDVDRAMQRTLEKNRELYRRLAEGPE